AAEVYGARILREGLEDHPENFTRFLLLETAPHVKETADKLSLVFTLAHRPGALHAALEPFARRALDLLRIESRPVRGRPWEYHFYLDLRAAPGPLADEAVAELREKTTAVRVLGHYPSATAELKEIRGI
ncbi:MAG TPA: hypothetical protein VNZ44_06470, partial [Pyrinomonadaceae bacterium]|nr:hypothetical protein [Pyrinomonadaceae bacterium]